MPDSSGHKYTNKETVKILKEALAAMEIKKYNFFKIRAYQNAVSVLDNLTSSIYDIWENRRLDEIPGIGEGLSENLNELFTTGKVAEFEKLKFGLPEGMFALIGVRGIGARKAHKLALAFKLVTRETALEELKLHAEKHEIQELDGFGEKSEADILEALEQAKLTKNEKQRMLLVKAEQIVARILEHMRMCPEVIKIDAAGSFRRRNPTIGDLDFIVATLDAQKVIEHFVTFSEVSEVLAKGEKKAMVVLKNDVQADIRISTPQAYGAMVQYNTGSKQHNILLRTLALEKGLSLSEYGIKKAGEIKEFDNEESFYKFVGLPHIPPELRQGSDEVEQAVAGNLPKLINLADIQGDLHTHTIASDGEDTLGDMVHAAIERGYRYYGVADHAPSMQTHTPDDLVELVSRARKQVDELNKSQNKIKVLLGYEVNILADKTLGLPDEVLKMLDYAIGSVHTAFGQSRRDMTDRIITALENEYINVLGHPSGRLINERDPVDADWTKIFDACVANGKTIEINAQPNRLDLADDLVRLALTKRVKLIVNTDAHNRESLDFMRFGIDVARRGWCEKGDIINCLGFEEFCRLLGVRGVFSK